MKTEFVIRLKRKNKIWIIKGHYDEAWDAWFGTTPRSKGLPLAHTYKSFLIALLMEELPGKVEEYEVLGGMKE